MKLAEVIAKPAELLAGERYPYYDEVARPLLEDAYTSPSEVYSNTAALRKEFWEDVTSLKGIRTAIDNIRGRIA